MIYQKLKEIELIVLDVDGVLTNSDLLAGDDGKLWRTMNARDGYALRRAIQANLNVIIITGGRNKFVEERLTALGIKTVFLGAMDKVSVLDNYLRENQTDYNNILYCGDDLVDLEVMKKVGLPVCPYDAVPEIKAISKYVCKNSGGKGCVRELIEMIMKLKGLW